MSYDPWDDPDIEELEESYPDVYNSRKEFEEDMEDMMFPEGRDDGFDIDDFFGLD